MNIQVALQLILRLLPSIILFVTAFLVVRDLNMRARWSEILFRAGSIRAEQKVDPQIQKGVRIPFLVLGTLFLLWPLWYYFRDSYAQMPVKAVTFPTPRPTPKPTPLPANSPLSTPAPTPFGTPPSLAPPAEASAALTPGVAPAPLPGNPAPVTGPTPVRLR